VLTGTGATGLLLATELSALGTFTTDLTNISNPEGVKCNTPGDAAGVVLLGGEVHGVQISLSPLEQGLLFLITEFEIECRGGVNVLIRGDIIATATGAGSEGTELTSFGGVLKGEKGKQEISEYYNDGGTEIKARLESEAGAGFTVSDENIAEEIPNLVLGSQMIVITGR
jgi:hypothetical protein